MVRRRAGRLSKCCGIRILEKFDPLQSETAQCHLRKLVNLAGIHGLSLKFASVINPNSPDAKPAAAGAGAATALDLLEVLHLGGAPQSFAVSDNSAKVVNRRPSRVFLTALAGRINLSNTLPPSCIPRRVAMATMFARSNQTAANLWLIAAIYTVTRGDAAKQGNACFLGRNMAGACVLSDKIRALKGACPKAQISLALSDRQKRQSLGLSALQNLAPSAITCRRGHYFTGFGRKGLGRGSRRNDCH
jgi:hypothetical protein